MPLSVELREICKSYGTRMLLDHACLAAETFPLIRTRVRWT
ncbi:MAG: hypothetical protein ACM3ZC_00640 [Bacteroidota bacterium]